MVSVVTSSDYLTSVNYVTVYKTREYAACNEAIATEYPLLQGSWDDPAINSAFKSLNDSKLEDLDPKYIQKQAKKATGLEARSSDLVYFQAYCNTAVFNSLTHSLTNYGIKIKHRWEEFCRYYQGLPILPAPFSDLNQPSVVVTPPAAEGEQFAALAQSSDQPTLVHTTCMAGYNLMFESLNRMEQGWMRTALRRAHTILHLPFVYPAGFNRAYGETLQINEPSFKTLGFSMCVRSSGDHVFGRACDIAGHYTRYHNLPDIGMPFAYKLSGTVQLRDYPYLVDYWVDPEYVTVEIKTDLKSTVTQQIENRVVRPTQELWDYSQSDVERTRIAELEASLQEARTYGQQQKEKLDAMVRLYNRTVRKDVAFRVTAAEPLSQVLASYEISRKYPMRQGTWGQTEIFALAIIAQITAKPVLLYRAGWAKPELVETSKHCFSGPIRVGSLSAQHMGRTFNTPQEWRAYYEPIIARLDSPDASA